MFRPMRRIRQQLGEAEALRILESCSDGVLALLGDDGYPYAVPMNYAFSDGKIYFHCARTGHKLDAIRACDKVSFCVTERGEVLPEELATRYRSVIVFGRARILSGQEPTVHAAGLIGDKYAADPAAAAAETAQKLPALCCVELTIEHITGKQSLDLALTAK